MCAGQRFYYFVFKIITKQSMYKMASKMYENVISLGITVQGKV